MLLAKIPFNLFSKEHFNIHYKLYKCRGCGYGFLILSQLKHHQRDQKHCKEYFNCHCRECKMIKIRRVRGYYYNLSAPPIYSAQICSWSESESVSSGTLVLEMRGFDTDNISLAGLHSHITVNIYING